MLFRKAPHVAVPASLEKLLDDVDGEGTPLGLLLQDNAENALTVGRVGILVDFPPAPPGATLADAARLNLRPTMQLYRAESIINWCLETVNNKKVPTLVVLKECADIKKADDEFVVKEETRWRVLDLVSGVYRQRVFRKKDTVQAADATEFEQVGAEIVPLMHNLPLSYIPFYANGVDDATLDDVDDPPLIDLVNTNISHYRTTADYAHGCHFTGLPTLFLSGFKSETEADGTPKKVYIGSESAIVTSSPDARGSYIEFSGQGLGALEKKLAREEQQMAVLGARMLEPMIRGVEAADTASIHRKGEESLLSCIANAISLSTTAALKTFVEWAGGDPTDVKIEINNDFYPAPMTPGMLTALLAGWQQGAPGLSDQGLFDALQAGEIIGEDVTLEEEQARIAERQQQLADQQAAAQAAFAGWQQDPQQSGTGAVA